MNAETVYIDELHVAQSAKVDDHPIAGGFLRNRRNGGIFHDRYVGRLHLALGETAPAADSSTNVPQRSASRMCLD